MAGFAALSFIEREFKRKKIKAYYYPLIILGAGILGLIVIKIASPSLYSLIISAPKTVFGIQQGGPSTIDEASSIFYDYGVFTMSKVYSNFTPTGFFASLLGMFILAANLFRKPKPQEVLLLIWSFLIFLAIYGQNRFAYYYSINVSVLSAYLGGLLLEKVKWSELDQRFKSNVKSPADIPKALKFVKVEQVFAVLLIVIFLIYPVYGSAMSYTKMVYGQPIQPWKQSCIFLTEMD